MRHAALFLAGLLVLAVSPPLVQAESWPARPIRWVVPTASGGPLDTMGRRLAQDVSKRLGQPIVIENRPGGGGSIGAAVVASSPPDGYTFLFSQADSLINSVSLIRNLPYDPRRDFALVTQATETGAVLMANPDVQGSTLDEVLKAGRAPGSQSLTYGSWGPGSYTHIAGVTLARRSGTPLVHVPYKGGAPAIQDMIARQISFAFGPPAFAAQLAQKGQAKLLAVTGRKRSSLVPEVPTFAELGYSDPLFRIGIWFGLSAPAGTPQPVIERMQAEVAAALSEPELAQFIAQSGAEPLGSTAAQFKEAFEKEYSLVNQAIRDAGVSPE